MRKERGRRRLVVGFRVRVTRTQKVIIQKPPRRGPQPKTSRFKLHPTPSPQKKKKKPTFSLSALSLFKNSLKEKGKKIIEIKIKIKIPPFRSQTLQHGDSNKPNKKPRHNPRQFRELRPQPSRPLNPFNKTHENSIDEIFIKAQKPMSSALQTPARVRSPPPQQKQRKFIVAKKNKNPTKGEENKDFDPKKCREVAYETLRASQEDFFRKDRGGLKDGSEKEEKGEKLEGNEVEAMRSLVMEEALSCIPEPGSGRVKHLVKAFESLLSISEENEGEKSRSDGRMARVTNWELPRLREPIMKELESVKDDEGGFPSVFSSGEFERSSRLYSSLDSNGDRLSLGSRTSNGSRRSRRNSMDSSRRSWNKKLKVTSQQPFKLRTEQRGRLKEENFIKKVKEMIVEEEKKRIPIAQGLPWTTDEPECLVKPPVKESTEPIDLVLHSDVRAVERAEFDHHVAERLSFIEQIKLERARLQKLEEEEEIRRLRKELVPKAQPMPYFDRPFVPKRSAKALHCPK